jgi:4-hydroxy-tetrahydrodipicolinate synthase
MFHGSIVALVTPMRGDGGLDFEALERLVEFHIDNGTDAIVSVGTTGESATLDTDDHCEVVKRTIGFVAGRLPVIAGTGANSTSEALYLTRTAQRLGADACLLVVPYYNKPPQQGLFEHFKTIADAVPIPQILYNVPGRTGCDMLPETVVRLAEISNIVGIKEASGSLERNRELIERCGDRLDILSGDDHLACETIIAGGRGVISVTANVAPALMHEMAGNALAGAIDDARDIDARLARLHAAMFAQPNPIPAKWALYKMGMIDRGIRLPMIELDERHHETVLAALEHTGVIELTA